MDEYSTIVLLPSIIVEAKKGVKILFPWGSSIELLRII